ncbi:protein of unknown function [Tenacibaculum aestuariivivum]
MGILFNLFSIDFVIITATFFNKDTIVLRDKSVKNVKEIINLKIKNYSKKA